MELRSAALLAPAKVRAQSIEPHERLSGRESAGRSVERLRLLLRVLCGALDLSPLRLPTPYAAFVTLTARPHGVLHWLSSAIKGLTPAQRPG